jgi:hypothetical protein
MEWQPRQEEVYWCLRGIPERVVAHIWENDRLDQLLRDTNLVFKTEKEANAALTSRCKPA